MRATPAGSSATCADSSAAAGPRQRLDAPCWARGSRFSRFATSRAESACAPGACYSGRRARTAARQGCPPRRHRCRPPSGHSRPCVCAAAAAGCSARLAWQWHCGPCAKSKHARARYVEASLFAPGCGLPRRPWSRRLLGVPRGPPAHPGVGARARSGGRGGTGAIGRRDSRPRRTPRRGDRHRPFARDCRRRPARRRRGHWPRRRRRRRRRRRGACLAIDAVEDANSTHVSKRALISDLGDPRHRPRSGGGYYCNRCQWCGPVPIHERDWHCDAAQAQCAFAPAAPHPGTNSARQGARLPVSTARCSLAGAQAAGRRGKV